MDCKQFQKLINDFIFDRVENDDVLKGFIEHYKQCNECREELSLYYTIHRGLDDIEAPYDEYSVDYDKELESIFKYYEDCFRRNRNIKKIIYLTICIAFVVMAVLAYNWLK